MILRPDQVGGVSDFDDVHCVRLDPHTSVRSIGAEKRFRSVSAILLSISIRGSKKSPGVLEVGRPEEPSALGRGR